MVGWFKERVIYTLIRHVGDGITWPIIRFEQKKEKKKACILSNTR
jgi:hypothetical protein